jgi:hypothetical protein
MRLKMKKKSLLILIILGIWGCNKNSSTITKTNLENAIIRISEKDLKYKGFKKDLRYIVSEYYRLKIANRNEAIELQKKVLPIIVKRYKDEPDSILGETGIFQFIVSAGKTKDILSVINGMWLKKIEQYGRIKFSIDIKKADNQIIKYLKNVLILNKIVPHGNTFAVIKNLLNKIYQNPKLYDTQSLIRKAIVDVIFDLRGNAKDELKLKFDREVLEILKTIANSGETGFSNSSGLCNVKNCRQSFEVNKIAALKLFQLGIINKNVVVTFLSTIFPFEKNSEKEQSTDKYKKLLKILNDKTIKNKNFNPVGILSLIARGDPAKHPLSFDKNTGKWFVYKDGKKLFRYGNEKNRRNLIRSKTVKQCMKNYEKYRKSDYFKYIHKKLLRNSKFKNFEEKLEKVKKEHEIRTKKWGEEACKIFVLNYKSAWKRKNVANVEKIAIKTLVFLKAGLELQNIYFDSYSSYIMKSYWDFTANQSQVASYYRCKYIENMIESYIKTHCDVTYNNKISGLRTQKTKLKNYDWFIDVSNESMLALTATGKSMDSKIVKKIQEDFIYRISWIKDYNSTLVAAKVVSMFPYSKNVFDKLVNLIKANTISASSKSKSEPFYLATQLLWNKYREQSIKLLREQEEKKDCLKLKSIKVKKRCEKLISRKFNEVMNIFRAWSSGSERWSRSRFVWIQTLQNYYGYWPVNPKTKKPEQMSIDQRVKEYKKYLIKCNKMINDFIRSPAGRIEPEKEPVCDSGYDKTKAYGWNIRNSQACKDMKKEGINEVECEKRLVLSGYERVRMKLLEIAFKYASKNDYKRLLKIKLEDINVNPGVHPLSLKNINKLTESEKIDYELMVLRPWDDLMEKNRVKFAKKLIKIELDRLKKLIQK